MSCDKEKIKKKNSLIQVYSWSIVNFNSYQLCCNTGKAICVYISNKIIIKLLLKQENTTYVILTPDVLAIALSFLARLDGLINVCVFAYLINK